MSENPTKHKHDLSHYSIQKKLTPELIAEHRKRLGSHFDTRGKMRGPNQWVNWAAVSAFTEKMGDVNPLFIDEEYAKNSCYGTVAAPPTFIMSIWRGMVIQGLPGIHIMMAGNDYEFLLPMLEGDKITADCVFADIEEKHGGKFQDLWFIEHWDSTFWNQEGQVVVKQRSHSLRHDREEAEDGYERAAKYSKFPIPHPWTEEEVIAIEDEQLNKKIQGATPLFWEDVKEGDILPDLVRGPFSITDAVAEISSHDITMGGLAGLIFHVRRHKGYSFFHPMSRAHEHIEILHWDKLTADKTGYPHPYDFGHSRQMWEMNAMTDWMGDNGWLKRNSAQYRGLVMLSDVVRIHSKITKKYIDDDGEPCVDIEHHAINQREQDVQPGSSTVALPSRERDYWPVRSRLARRGRLPKLPG